MSNRVLGLDVGPNSVGWALVDERKESIIATGVRVFPEGVDRNQQGGEKSKSQTRRDARGTRRQVARRARRKRQLHDLLVQAHLLPSDDDQLAAVVARNPYELRCRALEVKLQPHEIGRVLLHLNQRRGFLSNRKTDRGRAKETQGMLAEINELAQAVQSSDCRTLGEYLYRLHQRFDHVGSPDGEKIRKRHTRRDMYEDEFEAIWEAQRPYHPDLLTNGLKLKLNDTSSDGDWVHKGLIFGQRRVYRPKSIVGRCELEPKCRRCARADRAAQRFRILQEVNNLRILDRTTGEERRLTGDERRTLIEYLSDAKERTFDQLRKKLGFTEGVRFNLEGPDRPKLKGHETDAALGSGKVIGKKRWKALLDEVKDSVVTILTEEEDEREALRNLIDRCGLTDDVSGG